jgi:hypothetical protein
VDIHEQYPKSSMKKYLLNENPNETNIVDVYSGLILELKMRLVLIHWSIWMIEVYAIDDVKLNWQDN